jgi:mRNA-degrading endonuclease toxin of MazEF toxin-antitoxin module
VKPARGAVVLAELDPTIGHERLGTRPCIVVSDPDVIGDQRFPLVCVVTVTGTPGEGILYLRSQGEIAAIDQVLVAFLGL